MGYLAFSDQDRSQMLSYLGLRSVDDLFIDIPESIRIEGIDIDAGISELDVQLALREIAEKNVVFKPSRIFRGGGAYVRFIPAVVKAVISQPGFYSAYTPYQAEASQGWLQAIFEYQSYIAELTAMDVANASLYDGATALAEAAVMACVNTSKHKVVVAGYVNPVYLGVLRSFVIARGINVIEHRDVGGKVDLNALAETLGHDTAAVVFQNPNFLGLYEDAREIVGLAHDNGALAIQIFDPIMLAIMEAPGSLGVDIAVGEGQQFGIPLQFGGPYVGLIACRQDLVRRLPGRLVGIAYDKEGRRGFTLTLQAREQHIRRERATSNICTNHALMALAATVYLAYMGNNGLKQIAELSVSRAHYLQKELEEKAGLPLAFNLPFGFEFPVRHPDPYGVERLLVEKGILPGLPLGRWFPELRDAMLFCTTEVNDKNSIDELVEALS